MSIDDEMEAGVPSTSKTKEAEAGTLNPATFSLTDFVRRARPATKGVRLYARFDLLSDRDLAMTELEEARAMGDGERVLGLEQLCRDLTEEIRESAFDVKIEAWSSSKVLDFNKSLTNQGITDPTEQAKHLVCAQIVAPDGFTPELLDELTDIIEPQMTRLIQAVRNANQTIPQVSIPF